MLPVHGAGPPLVLLAAAGIDLLAQATAPEFAGWLQVFVNLGVAGYMLFWFSNRMERKIESFERRLTLLERSADTASRAQLLSLAVHRHASEEVKQEATRMVADLDGKAQNEPR